MSTMSSVMTDHQTKIEKATEGAKMALQKSQTETSEGKRHLKLRRTVSEDTINHNHTPGAQDQLTIDHATLIKEFELHAIPFLTREEFIKNFRDIAKLSEGSQATIFKVKWVGDKFQKVYALKKFDTGIDTTPQGKRNLKMALREFMTIKRLNHVPHLAHMYKLFYTYDAKGKGINVWILMDIYRDFFDYVTTLRKYPSVRLVYNWFQQMVYALYALHKNDIIHRDIKIENILMDVNNYDIYLADFGMLCDLRTKDPCNGAGTMEYFAPELIINNQATTKTDICSLGITFWSIWTGQQYYDEDLIDRLRSGMLDKYQLLSRYMRMWKSKFGPSFKPAYDPLNLWVVLLKMCDPNPFNRPSTRDLVKWVKYQKSVKRT